MSKNLPARFTDENAARTHLEALQWPDGPICPHCGTVDEASRIQGGRPGLWFCNACRKQFSVTVGTVFERSHIPLHTWLYANHLLCSSKKGISSHQLSRMLGVTYKTAWFMAHRIREAMAPKKPGPMGGEGRVIEADETYLGKRDGKPSKPDTFISGFGWVSHPKIETQRKIVSLVERGGQVRSFKVDRVTKKTLRQILFTNADRKSTLMTDEHPGYQTAGWNYADHFTVNHGQGEYGRGSAYTNTIEGYFSIFKRGMKGIYQHCSEQHLQRYLAEFDFRYSNRSALGVEDTERATKALQGIVGKRLTYRRTNEAAHA
jgi:transposase-like protein